MAYIGWGAFGTAVAAGLTVAVLTIADPPWWTNVGHHAVVPIVQVTTVVEQGAGPSQPATSVQAAAASPNSYVPALPMPDETMPNPPSTDPQRQTPIGPGMNLIGRPDLARYCARLSPELKPVLRFNNAWGYRCAAVDGLAGNRQGDQSISMTDACSQTYPNRLTVDHYTNYDDPYSWGCWA